MTEHASEEPRRTSPRLLGIIVLLLLAGAGVLWSASALGWTAQRFRGELSGETAVELAGADVRPELVPFALLTLAAIAAVLATGGWLRRSVGLLIAAAGALVLTRSVNGWSTGWSVRRGAGPAGSEPVGELTVNPVGPLLMTVGGLVLVVAGVLVTIRARRLPAMGSKYSAPRAREDQAKDPDRTLWEALDAGADPTADDRER
ncbi:Trp biosynthesis-associated membrane protein [Parasphingorhabdus pacifica]